eukprot:s125_g2.t3
MGCCANQRVALRTYWSKLQFPSIDPQVQDAELKNSQRYLGNVKKECEGMKTTMEELELQNTIMNRAVAKTVKDKEESMMQHDILRLEVKRLRQQLTTKSENLYSLENRKQQLQISMEEREKEIEVHTEVLRAQLRSAEEEKHKAAIELAERKQKIFTLKSKYDNVMCKVKKEEGGEQLSQAHYMIKAAQEKEELQRKGDELDDKIRRAEKEIRSLENTLGHLVQRNQKFKENLQTSNMQNQSELEEKQTLEEQSRAANEVLFKKKKVLTQLEQEAQEDVQRYEELQRSMQQMEAHVNELTAARDVLRQDIGTQAPKIERAQQTLANAQTRAIQSGVDLAPEAAAAVDVKARGLREQNQSLLFALSNALQDYGEDVLPLFENLCAERGVAMPSRPPPGMQASGGHQPPPARAVADEALATTSQVSRCLRFTPEKGAKGHRISNRHSQNPHPIGPQSTGNAFAMTIRLGGALACGPATAPERQALLANLDDPSRRLLLTADQVVTYEGQIREKPESMEEARAFLASYALAPCRTVGALCLHDLSSRQRVVGVADIFFKPSIANEDRSCPNDVLTELESETALLECAGALMVEHPLIECHVDRVEGGLDSVQGLSLPLLRDLWGQLQADRFRLHRAEPYRQRELLSQLTAAQRLRIQRPLKSCALLASRQWELQAAVLPVQSRRFFFGGRSDGGNKGDSSGETPATSSDTDKAERSGGGRISRGGRAGSNNGVAAQDDEGAIVPMKPDGHGQLRKDGGTMQGGFRKAKVKQTSELAHSALLVAMATAIGHGDKDIEYGPERADGLKVPEVFPEGSRWRLVALGISLCLFHLVATYPLPDDLVFTVPVNRPYHHMRLTVFFGFGIPFLTQGHGKTRLRLQPLLTMLIFWLTLQSILLVSIGMWLQLGLAIALLIAVIVLAWPILRSTDWIWDFGRGAYRHLRDSNTAIPVKIYTVIFSLFPFGLIMPIFGPWERVQLWVRWRPYNVEAELLWRGTFATFFLSFFFTAANPKVNNAIVAFFAAHGICHSISMFFDNRITPTYGNENVEHLLEISLFMVLGLGFEPWSIALPVFRRPLFPMQNHIIQVTSPTLTKELIRAFEKRPGQNYVSLFLHKQVPPAFEMPEKRDDGDEAGEAAEGQVPQVQATAELEELGSENPMEVLCRVGTRAKVMQAMPVVSQSGQQVGLQMLVNGIDIVRMEEVLQKGPPLQVKISQVKYENEDPPDDMLKATMNETMQTIKEIMKVNPGFREYASMINQSYYDRVEKMKAHVVAHFAAALTSADGMDLQKVLEATNAQDKSRLALELVKKELELSKLQQKIASQIEDKMNKHQREFMLREQLKSIKKELGIDKDDGSDALLQKFKQRLEEKTVPKEVKEAIDQELEKFANLAKESQEYQMTRNYLEWLTNMPWGVYSKDTFDLKKAREILDRDHYGLADIKDRIREFIAVGVLRGSMQGKILCFVGPPGVGKTSIGKSIAEALGREFYRFSVGGLYDVAEIKGHRRTYVGAMPGKVIQCLKKTQTANPLILIDEVDKIGRGHQGDPSSALLELLDPSQNNSFVDHYLDTIPGPLLDRMEVIRLTGYDLQEKMRIAQDYLVPNAMVEVGLRQKEVKTSEQAVTADAPTGEALTAAGTSEAGSDEANDETSKAVEPVKPTIKASQRS